MNGLDVGSPSSRLISVYFSIPLPEKYASQTRLVSFVRELWKKRSPFRKKEHPFRVFSGSPTRIEVLERFAYYGIYFGFGIYMASLGYSRAQLGIVQSLFLLLSYGIPVIAGTFADRYGFKKILIVSYLAYLPAILLLIFTKSFSGIVLTMLSIGLAAGIFKPLVAGTVRAVTDKTNKTLGFGIFYAMVNVGGSFGPIVLGKLRAISWNYAFLAAAASIVVMLFITIFFYEEPERETEGETLGEKLKEIGVALSDLRFTFLLVLLGVFFWLPFWCFFNLCAVYVDGNLDTARLYESMRGVLGSRSRRFLLSSRRGRNTAHPGRDHLAHRLDHHDLPGFRVTGSRALQSYAHISRRTLPDVPGIRGDRLSRTYPLPQSSSWASSFSPSERWFPHLGSRSTSPGSPPRKKPVSTWG